MSIIYLADYFIDWINFNAIGFLKKITIEIEKYLYFLQKGQKSTKMLILLLNHQKFRPRRYPEYQLKLSIYELFRVYILPKTILSFLIPGSHPAFEGKNEEDP